MFVSYAQNFEDVILWRALKHIERGFYIDIGAQDPTTDSVSRAFYEHGWRGVHVEPNRDYAEKLREARPDEDIIAAAVTHNAGPMRFYEVPHSGLSTGLAEIAEGHATSGFPVTQVMVETTTLAAILDAHSERDIHWLKIDVEGMEDDVIRSWSPSPVRPWIVVLESTRPNSPTPSHDSWEAFFFSSATNSLTLTD
jgi:FkbM family methyltransferase